MTKNILLPCSCTNRAYKLIIFNLGRNTIVGLTQIEKIAKFLDKCKDQGEELNCTFVALCNPSSYEAIEEECKSLGVKQVYKSPLNVD